MAERDWIVERVETDRLSASDLQGIRRLMDAAFGARFTEEDWGHALGGMHFFIRDEEGAIVSHAAVVSRELHVSGVPYDTGYVEAVATDPKLQRRGLATAVMRAVAEFIEGRYQMGALSSSVGFYENLGWIRWRGPTWCREGNEVVRTSEEDGGVWVLPTRSSAPLDVESAIVAEWREGDVW